MTREQFLSLPATRKGMTILANEFQTTGNIFFNEVSRQLRTHIQLPASVKKIVGKFSFNSVLSKYEELQSMGFRKELVIPF